MTLPIPAPQDYTDRDYAAIRVRVQQAITQAFPEWTDFNRSHLENALLDASAWMFDHLTFYLDQMARETRFGTARHRKSMIELCRLIEYELSTQEAAATDVIFSIATITAGNVNIPIGTIVKTLGVGSQVVRSKTTVIATIPAGSLNSAATAVKNSQDRSDTFTAAGEQGEEFELASKPFLDGSETVTIAAAPWTRVDHFLDSGPTDLHYTVRVSEFDIATIKLGDGELGSAAAPGAAVVIDYETGGGETGNIDAGALRKVEGGPFYDVLGNQVTLTCNNAAAAVGGLDRESVEQARVRAPRSLRVLNRCVAKTDFEDLAIQVSGVARALALSSNQDPAVAEGKVQVWIVPIGGGAAPGALLTAVETYINTNYPVPIVCSWDAFSAPYVVFNIVAYVYLNKGAAEATIAANVRDALRRLFAEQSNGDPNELVNFGAFYTDSTGAYDGQFPLDLVAKVISGEPLGDVIPGFSGIARLGTPTDGEGIAINGSEDNVTLLLRQFPTAIGGTLQLINGETTLSIYNGPIL
jgi:uncharacterized phage protein gp47/JayE